MKHYIILTVILPLLVAFLLPTIGRFSYFLARALPPIILIFSIVITACVYNNETAPFALHIGDFVAPQGIVFHVDSISLLMALSVQVFALFLWPRRSFKLQSEQIVSNKRYSLMLLLVASANGLAFSGDLFNLYVFYELLAVATFGLISFDTNEANKARFAAAFRYLVISATGSVMALLGIALVYFLTGTLNFAHLATQQANLFNPIGLSAFALLLVGFGVKAELFPVNSWVPEVYSAASKKLSGYLAGVISKLAVLVIIKALLFIFPHSEAAYLMLGLGLAGLLIGELSAMRSNDFTRMISWSSVAQLGLVFIAFSIPGQAGIIAGLAVLFHHMFVKTALFLIAEKWGGRISDLHGQGYLNLIMSGIFIFVALSLIGLPPLPGFWSKFLLLNGLAGQEYYFAIAIILITTVIEVNYLFRVANHLFSREDKPVLPINNHHWFDTLTASLIVVALIVAVWELPTINDQLIIMSDQLLDIESYVNRVLISTENGL